MLLVLIALIILVWLLIQTTFFQNFLVRQVTNKLSKDLQTTVHIQHVDFDLFNTMLLEGTLIKDKRNDTLLFAGAAKVLITDWFFFKEKVELEYVGLQNAVIHAERTDSIWNYQFLIDYFSGPKKPGQKKNIELNLKQVELDNVAVIQKDGWRGENLSAVVKSLDIDAERFDLNNRRIVIRSINMNSPSFSIYNYVGTRKRRPVVNEEEPEIVNNPDSLRWNADKWQIVINRLTIHDGAFKSDKETERDPYPFFDGNHIFFSGIDGRFNNVKLDQDSITADVSLKTKERSGFVVKSLTAKMRMHPEAMEFEGLDLQTNRSRLTDFFAMRYRSFDDMGDFVTKVRMEANFKKADLSSDDIAFFAPDVETWKKKIQITGKVEGSVENLNGRNLIVLAGKDTYLSGNVSVAGLPDINKTYIDFETNGFRTTYNDAVSFVPQLKNITQPRLERLEYLHFRGNFTGFIEDFVTYGTLETKLGSLVTDLNMKLPQNGVASYSGSIKTDGFRIGELVENSQLGTTSFEGTIQGRGLSAGTLNSKLDGTIHTLEFNNYQYKNITVKGQVAKRLFNGELISYDPNLDAQLNGLIDFSKDIPQFNFDASLEKVNLQRLNLTKENIEFDGKFRFDFTGNNIDNFLGTARVYESSLFRNGKQISFDSLFLESKIMDNNKVITVLSNEFDAVLVGEFSLSDLPGAFQTFLNKYYPAYIKPVKTATRNENFSFVITTKNVEEYINLFDKNLSRFNFSTLTGRINTKENLLDLNADVPEFNYKNIAVQNLSLKASGTYDSLSLETNIANVAINDSLNFPDTYLKLTSSNDLSDVVIRTSANQTLNAANLSAQVQTLPKGARITFKESNFDLNGKNWTIEKDGQLIFTETLVVAEGVKLYNGLQQIQVTTVPSDIGNTNDILVDLEKVIIGDFSPYLVPKNRMEGLLTGTINIADPFRRLTIDVNAKAEQFRLDDDSIGNVALNANYSQRMGSVNFSAKSDNQFYDFDLKGIYNLADSVTKDRLDITAQLKDTKIDLLEKYLSGVFGELSGLATGNLRITGQTNNLDYLGKVTLREGRLRVRYTNVVYTIPTATFDFLEDRIDFGAFQIRDTFGNIGEITRGKLFHEGFDQLAFDFAMNTRKLLVLATNNTGTDPFYGNVIARANMTFNGPLDDMQMDITAAPADSSSLYINTRTGRESGQADFVVWKVYGREMEAVRSERESNLSVRLDVTANNFANMYVILDELTGDVIQANGRGNLQISASTDGEFTIVGRYDIDRGNYNFNFESLLKKPFRLREGVGNYIQWSGDPNNAMIKIDAEYEAENVRFSDLALNQTEAVNENVRKYRGKVLVIASLTGELMEPDIKFQIDLPQGSPLKNDQDAARVLTLIQNDENELNKQVAFLIVFNSFGPLSTSTVQSNVAGAAFEGIVVGSISGVLSNTLSRQFSSIFQKIFNDKSIRVNFNAQLYSGTNFLNTINRNPFSIDRTNLNLSIGKSLFNERLTFTFGSAIDFGLSSAQVNATRNLPFLPDITAEWKITPDGKLVLTFFYRDTYNYLSGAGARQNRSGASISYRRDFDRIRDLWSDDRRRRQRARVQSRESGVGSREPGSME